MPSFLSRLKAATGLLTGKLSAEQTALLMGIQPAGRGDPPRKNTEQFLDAYNTAPWLRGAGGRVAQSFASVKWTLYSGRAGKNGKIVRLPDCQRGDFQSRSKALARVKDAGNLTEITEHPMLDLLYRGNALFTGIAIRRLLSVYLDITGDAFWLKERNGLGAPIAAWPIPAHWVQETPSPANPNYRVSFRSYQKIIPDTEILWFKDPNPVNPYSRGSGLAMTLGDELDTDEAAAKMARARFYNRGTPDLVVTPGTGLSMSAADMKLLESKWGEKARRYAQSVVPMFMNAPVTVQEVGQSFRDLQFTDLREFERNVVMQTFGIPPEMLGVLEHSNRATIDAAEVIMGRYVLQPRLEFVREILQERLAPEFDQRLIVQYENPVADDKAQQILAATAAPWAPTVDEWRGLMGLEKLAGTEGDQHVVPMGLSTVANLSELGSPADQMPAPAAVPPADQAAA